jgi:protein subunit release factor A
MNPDHLLIQIWPPRENKGGQTVGDSIMGVRIEHIPTGTVAIVTNARSQMKNRTIALEMIEWALASKLLGW